MDHTPTISIQWISTTLSSALLLCGVIGLSACMSPQSIPSTTQDLQDNWRVRGKFVFETEENRESGNFDWRQTADNYHVRFFGPLGFGSVKIRGDQQQATILSSRGETQSSNPDELIYELTGVQVPLTEVPAWLAGRPVTFHPEHSEVDERGNIVGAVVRGWQINYQRFEDQHQRPRQIIATQNGNTLKLIALKWQ